ncbi:hypothetical protein KEM60_02192 [Austwickia sp. TVS 96-490-7B]|nr:hypothetical protein [Austwickia sp. TVS 96-490-7B]
MIAASLPAKTCRLTDEYPLDRAQPCAASSSCVPFPCPPVDDDVVDGGQALFHTVGPDPHPPARGAARLTGLQNDMPVAQSTIGEHHCSLDAGLSVGFLDRNRSHRVLLVGVPSLGRGDEAGQIDAPPGA